MKKIILSISLCLSLFGKEIDSPEVNDFYANPYLKVNQEKVLNFVKNQEYRTNFDLMDLLEDVYVYSNDKDILNESRKLFENNVFEKEKIIKDETTGKTKVIKKSDKELTKYEQIKYRIENSIKHVFVLEKDKNLTEADNLYFKNFLESKSKRGIEETLYQIKYMVKKGNYKEASEVFDARFDKITRNIEKEEFKDNNRFILGDVYSYACLLNYENKELYEKYKAIALKAYNNDLVRFNAILGIELQEKEEFIQAQTHLEEIRAVISDQHFLNYLLEAYYKGTRKDLLNQNYKSSWNQARKAIIMSEQILVNNELKIKYTPILLELKKHLKTSSGFYIEELINNGENSHANRIKKETINLIEKDISMKKPKENLMNN